MILIRTYPLPYLLLNTLSNGLLLDMGGVTGDDR
jgi:hypothetical protein